MSPNFRESTETPIADPYFVLYPNLFLIITLITASMNQIVKSQSKDGLLRVTFTAREKTDKLSDAQVLLKGGNGVHELPSLLAVKNIAVFSTCYFASFS